MVEDPLLEAMFDSLVHWKIANGSIAHFWQDRWINGHTAAEIAPLVLLKVSARCLHSRRGKEGLSLNRWVSDIAGGLSTVGIMQYVHFSDAVHAITLDPNAMDEAIWKWSPSGAYSASSTYNILCGGAVGFSCAKALWKSWVPLNCKFFICLALQYMIWT